VTDRRSKDGKEECPRTEPCGTPVEQLTVDEWQFSIET
jgi:hypothetical protein